MMKDYEKELRELSEGEESLDASEEDSEGEYKAKKEKNNKK